MPFFEKTDQMIGFDVLLLLARKWLLLKNIDQRKKNRKHFLAHFFLATKEQNSKPRAAEKKLHPAILVLNLALFFNHSDGAI